MFAVQNLYMVMFNPTCVFLMLANSIHCRKQKNSWVFDGGTYHKKKAKPQKPKRKSLWQNKHIISLRKINIR